MEPRVLIIDGHVEDVQFMSDLLALRGFAVDVARDGEHAFEMLEQRRAEVVILDVAGPNGNGMEILDRIRANPHLAATPVIIVTARTGDDDVLAGYKFGADYYLTTPLTARRLLRAVGLVLGREFPE